MGSELKYLWVLLGIIAQNYKGEFNLALLFLNDAPSHFLKIYFCSEVKQSLQPKQRKMFNDFLLRVNEI